MQAAKCCTSARHATLLIARVQLAERISAGYVWLWPKQRPAAHEAVQQLLLTLAGKPHLLHRALPQLVGSMLSHTLKPPEGRPGEAHGDAQASQDILQPCMRCYAYSNTCAASQDWTLVAAWLSKCVSLTV